MEGRWCEIMSLAAAAAGLCVFSWYHTLPREKQLEANKLAAEFAVKLFFKAYDELNPFQKKDVHLRVQKHFN